MEDLFILAVLAFLAAPVLSIIALTRTSGLSALRERLARVESTLAELRQRSKDAPATPAPASAGSPDAARRAVLDSVAHLPAPARTAERAAARRRAVEDSVAHLPVVGPREPAQPVEQADAAPAAELPVPETEATEVTEDPTHATELTFEGPPPSVNELLPSEPDTAQPAPAATADWAPRSRLELERLLGVRAAAVVGGVLMVLAGVFFLRYAVQHGWFGPLARVTVASVVGLTLLVAHGPLRRRRLDILADALAGTGAVLLYASAWASHHLYEFTGLATTFAWLAATTVLTAWTAERRRAQVVALFAVVGGFATPLLLSGWREQSVGFFGYTLALDLGLLWLAWRRGWSSLAALALAGTTLLQVIWNVSVVDESSALLGLGSLTVFGLLFAGGARGREDADDRVWRGTRIVGAVVPLLLAWNYALRVDLGVALWQAAMFFLPLGALVTAGHRRDATSRAPLATASATVGLAGAFFMRSAPTVAGVLELVVVLLAASCVQLSLAGRGRRGSRLSLDLRPELPVLVPALGALMLLFGATVRAGLAPDSSLPLGLAWVALAPLGLVAWTARARVLAWAPVAAAILASAATIALGLAAANTLANATIILGVLSAAALVPRFVPGRFRARTGYQSDPQPEVPILIPALATFAALFLAGVRSAEFPARELALGLPALALVPLALVAITARVRALAWVRLTASAGALLVAASVFLRPTGTPGGAEMFVGVLCVAALLQLFSARTGEGADEPLSTVAVLVPLLGALLGLSMSGFLREAFENRSLGLGVVALGLAPLGVVAWLTRQRESAWAMIVASAVAGLLVVQVGTLTAAGALIVVAAALTGLMLARPWRAVRTEYALSVVALCVPNVWRLSLADERLVAAMLLLVGLATVATLAATLARSQVLHGAVVVAVLLASVRQDEIMVSALGVAPPPGLVLMRVALIAVLCWTPLLLRVRRLGVEGDRSWHAAALAPVVLGLPVVELMLGGGHASGLQSLLAALVAAAGGGWLLRLTDDRRGAARFLAAGALLLGLALGLQVDVAWFLTGSFVGVCLAGLVARRMEHARLLKASVWGVLALAGGLVLAAAFDGFFDSSGWLFNGGLAWSYLVPAVGCVALALRGRSLLGERMRSALGFAAATLVFVWLNLTVFDHYETARRIHIDLQRSQAQNLVQSISWALYALALLAIGARRALSAIRWVSLGVLSIALCKVALYDLGELEGLYRVASFAGLALALFTVSLFYQRCVFRPATGQA